MVAAGTAVVTGASSGIGEAIAAALLDRGTPVVALQRSAPKLQHRDLHFRRVDLTDLAAARKVANDVAAEFPVRYPDMSVVRLAPLRYLLQYTLQN